MVLGYLMLALAVSAAAQPPVRTDFSGTWVLDVGRSTSAGEGRGAARGSGGGRGGGLGLGPLPDRLVIRQTADSMIVEEHRGHDIATVTYPFTTTVSNKLPAGNRAGVMAEYASRWQDQKLITTISVEFLAGAGAREVFLETRYIGIDGRLVVETTTPDSSRKRTSVYNLLPR